MDDLVGLIRGEHARICRLFEELEEAADNPARLAELWAELRVTLLAHLGAFEEIFFLPLLGAVADRLLSMRQLNDQKLEILDAVAEARLQRTGSPLWWLSVRAARVVANQHIRSVETGGLPRFGQQTPEWARRQLVQQWNQFMADISSDPSEGLCPAERDYPAQGYRPFQILVSRRSSSRLRVTSPIQSRSRRRRNEVFSVAVNPAERH